MINKDNQDLHKINWQCLLKLRYCEQKLIKIQGARPYSAEDEREIGRGRELCIQLRFM